MSIPSSAEGGLRGGFRANSPTRSPVLRAGLSTPAVAAGDPSPNPRAGRSIRRNGSSQGLPAAAGSRQQTALSPLAAADPPQTRIDVSQWSFASGEGGEGSAGKGKAGGAVGRAQWEAGMVPGQAGEGKQDEDDGTCSPDTSSFVLVPAEGGRGGFAQLPPAEPLVQRRQSRAGVAGADVAAGAGAVAAGAGAAGAAGSDGNASQIRPYRPKSGMARKKS